MGGDETAVTPILHTHDAWQATARHRSQILHNLKWTEERNNIVDIWQRQWGSQYRRLTYGDRTIYAYRALCTLHQSRLKGRSCCCDRALFGDGLPHTPSPCHAGPALGQCWLTWRRNHVQPAPAQRRNGRCASCGPPLLAHCWQACTLPSSVNGSRIPCWPP